MHQYMLVNKIGEGAFSEVLKSQSLKTGTTVAIKCMKNQYTTLESVQKLREIQALKKLSAHPHIVKLLEVLYDEPTGRLALVFELMEQNLYDSIKIRKSYLSTQKVKFYMYQVLKAVEHMHRNGIFHRDIKPENILLKGDHVKVADLGSCKGVHSQLPYTEYISTRWYRAPECLMTDGYYDYKMDLWGVGSVMFEIISLFPLFPGKNELDQVHKIHNILGTPDPKVLERFAKHASHMEFNFPQRKGTGLEKLIPHASKDCIDLLYKLLTYDPVKRITAEEALQHEYFKEFQQIEQGGPMNSTFSSMRFSPTSQIYRKSLEQTQAYEQGKSNNNFSQTQKGILPINPYQQTYSNKNKWNKKQKQPSIKGQGGGSGYYPQQIKVDVKIEGFNHSGTDDEPEQKLPPIKHMETKNNFNYTIKPEKKQLMLQLNPYNQGPNPYQQNQYKNVKKNKLNVNQQQQANENYMILGKKAAFN